MKLYLQRFMNRRWTYVEFITLICGSFLTGAIGWLFFRHLVAVLLMLPVGVVFVPLLQELLRERQQKIMRLDFSRFLQSLISALYAGHSLESAFREIERDMTDEARQGHHPLLDAVKQLNRRTALGESIDKTLPDVSSHLDLEELQLFAETLTVFRQNGGNVLLHLRRTADLLIEKMEAEQDVQVILAKKRVEAIMMNIAPYFMIGLVLIGSQDYAAPLYAGGGRIVMVSALLLILLGHVWTYHLLRRGRP